MGTRSASPDSQQFSRRTDRGGAWMILGTADDSALTLLDELSLAKYESKTISY